MGPGDEVGWDGVCRGGRHKRLVFRELRAAPFFPPPICTQKLFVCWHTCTVRHCHRRRTAGLCMQLRRRLLLLSCGSGRRGCCLQRQRQRRWQWQWQWQQQCGKPCNTGQSFGAAIRIAPKCHRGSAQVLPGRSWPGNRQLHSEVALAGRQLPVCWVVGRASAPTFAALVLGQQLCLLDAELLLSGVQSAPLLIPLCPDLFCRST